MSSFTIKNGFLCENYVSKSETEKVTIHKINYINIPSNERGNSRVLVKVKNTDLLDL